MLLQIFIWKVIRENPKKNRSKLGEKQVAEIQPEDIRKLRMQEINEEGEAVAIDAVGGVDPNQLTELKPPMKKTIPQKPGRKM